MIKIFVIHYDKLIERKNNILKQLNDRKLEAEFVSNYGKESLTLEDKQKFTRISDSEISTFYHHLECYKKIVENNYEYALILEDDAIFLNKFYIKLKKYVYDLPKDWSILYVGDGNVRVPKEKYNKYMGIVNIFRKPANGFKYTDFYLITNSACKKFIEQFTNEKEPVNVAVDHYLHAFINTYKLKAFIGEPKLVAQGSINKKFTSSIWHTTLNDAEDINAINTNFKEI
jgi:glycosyl transferase family 25